MAQLTLSALSTQAALQSDSVYATLEARGAVCEDGFVLGLPDEVISSSNEDWTVFTCSPRSNSGVVDPSKGYTTVINHDLSQTWIISHEGLDWRDIQQPSLSTYRWSADGSYLYLVPFTYPGASGFNASSFFGGDSVLYRLNLGSGEFETILPESGNFSSFALSPDDQILAYVTMDEQGVVYLRNMDTGEETAYPLDGDFVNTGAFVWTPDSNQVIFASAIEGWLENKAGISIVKITLRPNHIQVILNNDPRLLIPWTHFEDGEYEYWRENGILNLISINFGTELPYYDWAIDIRTGIVLKSSPPTTPQP